MKNFTQIALIAGIAASVFVTGCSSWGHKETDRTAGRKDDDNRITSQVKSQLNNEPVYKFADVDVRAFNGVVQLSGFVNTQDQKQRAGEVASSTPGVARVLNNIALKPESPLIPTGRTNQNTYPQNQNNLNRNQNLDEDSSRNSPTTTTNHVQNP